MVLSLSIICLSMGLILGLVYGATKKPIEETQIKAKTEALSKVLPDFDNNPLEETQLLLLEGDTDSIQVYIARKGEAISGYAVESFTKNGFGGKIDLMVGFEVDGTIKDFTVLSHAETPGLGAKMQVWFQLPARSEGTIRDFRGLKMAEEHPLKVTKDGGKVDAITASTITSRAFLDAVERAYSAFLQCISGEVVDAVTAPTQDEPQTPDEPAEV